LASNSIAIQFRFDDLKQELCEEPSAASNEVRMDSVELRPDLQSAAVGRFSWRLAGKRRQFRIWPPGGGGSICV